MAQVSKRKLNKEIEGELFRQLWGFLSRARDSDTAHQLYSDLLTETERVVLAKRLATALLILEGRTTGEIQNLIKISSSTVSNVAQWLKYTRPKTIGILKRLTKEKGWKEVMGTMGGEEEKGVLADDPEWRQVGQDKYKRIK